MFKFYCANDTGARPNEGLVFAVQTDSIALNTIHTSTVDSQRRFQTFIAITAVAFTGGGVPITHIFVRMLSVDSYNYKYDFFFIFGVQRFRTCVSVGRSVIVEVSLANRSLWIRTTTNDRTTPAFVLVTIPVSTVGHYNTFTLRLGVWLWNSR